MKVKCSLTLPETNLQSFLKSLSKKRFGFEEGAWEDLSFVQTVYRLSARLTPCQDGFFRKNIHATSATTGDMFF